MKPIFSWDLYLVIKRLCKIILNNGESEDQGNQQLLSLNGLLPSKMYNYAVIMQFSLHFGLFQTRT